MLFNLADVILIVIVFSFAVAGFMLGLIEAIGALIGLALGAWLAGQYYGQVAGWMASTLHFSGMWSNIVAFLLIFGLVNRLIALVFWLINKIFKIASLIPFVGTINRFAGLILGFVEGILVCGLALYVMAKFGGQIPWLISAIDGSKIAHALVGLTSFLTALLPEALNKIQSIF